MSKLQSILTTIIANIAFDPVERDKLLAELDELTCNAVGEKQPELEPTSGPSAADTNTSFGELAILLEQVADPVPEPTPTPVVYSHQQPDVPVETETVVVQETNPEPEPVDNQNFGSDQEQIEYLADSLVAACSGDSSVAYVALQNALSLWNASQDKTEPA